MRLLTLAVPIVLGLAGPAWAHDESVSASEILVEGAQVTWTVDVGLAGLAKVVAFAGTGPGASSGGELSHLGEAEIQAAAPAITRYLAGQLQVWLDGVSVAGQPGPLVPRHETLPGASGPSITRVALPLRFRAAGPISELRARLAFFSPLTSAHRAVLHIRWDGEQQQLTRLGVAEVRFEKGRIEPSAGRVTLDFVAWGAHHIFIGFDHIAFLLALLLAVSRVRQLLLIVTAFTVAHSLTILLAAFDLVRLPPAITEALIAASIVYVAIENLLFTRRPPGGRAVLAFVFGLVHGLGFAEVLRERLDQLGGGIVAPVLAFNLGVELGQLAIVALAFPVLLRLRARFGDRPVMRAGSIVILVLGLVWLVQRLFL